MFQTLSAGKIGHGGGDGGAGAEVCEISGGGPDGSAPVVVDVSPADAAASAGWPPGSGEELQPAAQIRASNAAWPRCLRWRIAVLCVRPLRPR